MRRTTGHAPSVQFDTTVQTTSVSGSQTEQNEHAGVVALERDRSLRRVKPESEPVAHRHAGTVAAGLDHRLDPLRGHDRAVEDR